MANTPLIHDDFLLETPAAVKLYHEYAEGLPIIDYHCHLDPARVADDQRWDNIAQVWLAGDHYKWRAMRSNGVPEALCTGDAPDREKFDAFAATMPYLLRNPMYHWTHLELARYFGISDRVLNEQTGPEIWEECNEVVRSKGFSARGLMAASNVVCVCTTDDPIDSLEYHQAVAADASFGVQVLPTWRPDKGMALNTLPEFNAWVDTLAAVSDTDIGDSFEQYLVALRARHDFFHTVGCRLSDHGLETVYGDDYTASEIETIFAKARSGAAVSQTELQQFHSAMMFEFGVMDAEKGWTQQIHYGAIRNNNTRMFQQAGADIGMDSVADREVAAGLSRCLDRMDQADKLPKTILYNLNPRDNYVLATMIGNFMGDGTPGKLQLGSGWWFLDQMEGMEWQMNALSSVGVLRRFVGMLTDSRSFLSYTRHEYFRRILCNMLGSDIEKGRIPRDFSLVGAMVKEISYTNAANYFGFDVPQV